MYGKGSEGKKQREGGRGGEGERGRGRERSWGKVEGYKATEQKAIGHVAFLGKREEVLGGGGRKWMSGGSPFSLNLESEAKR